MTAPIQRKGNGIFLLSHDCVSEFFLLTPNEEVNQLFEYSVSRAAEEHNVAVFAKSALSNRIQLVVGERDLTSDISAFKQSLSANLTRGINNKYKRQGSIWVNRPFHEKQLHSAEAVLEAMTNTMTSPVAAGLVARPELWPGVVTEISQLGTRIKTCNRPKLFGKRSTQPATTELVLDIPEVFREQSSEQFRQQLKDLVNERIEDILAERKSQGIKSYLGVRKIRKQRIDQRPKDFKKVKGVVTKKEIESRARHESCQERQNWISQYKQFLKGYDEAFETWQTDKTVAFPAGTYKMRKVHNVRIQ